MKRTFLYAILCLFSLFSLSNTAWAKVWRVNNNLGVSADFTQPLNAMNAASAGDTIYIEASPTTYNSFTLNKKLVIIGPGYFLDQNTGLQAHPNTANVSSIAFDNTASGSQIYGLTVSGTPTNGADDITISRCNIVGLTSNNSNTYSNWIISQCYFSGNFSISSSIENWQIINNIFTSGFFSPNGMNLLIRNNTFQGVAVTATNAYFTNNLLLDNSTVNNVTSSVLKYNMATGNILPTGPTFPGNQNNIAKATIILGAGSSDGRYQLNAGSPAIGAGETVSGVTPDIGAFGTAVPYRLSGIPPIPTIYALTVPNSIPSTSTNMTITVSTRSNN